MHEELFYFCCICQQQSSGTPYDPSPNHHRVAAENNALKSRVFTLAACGHRYCLSCIRRLVRSSVRERQLNRLQCCATVVPSGDASSLKVKKIRGSAVCICGVGISDEDVRTLLTSSSKDRSGDSELYSDATDDDTYGSAEDLLMRFERIKILEK